MLTRLGILLMRALALLPLSWLRGIGAGIASVLYLAIPKRRKIALANLGLCFPELPEAQRIDLAKQHFRVFAQTFLDRAWLWHASPDVTRRRLKLVGDVAQFEGNAPIVIFAPHFLGLDAGATALSQQVARNFDTIFTEQTNKVADAWIARGRQRFGNARLLRKSSGVKSIVAAIRRGEPLYLLPDMDFGPAESVFVPFFGVPTATVPSLSRFTRLGRAKVVPVTARMTDEGYEVTVHPAWEDFPSADPVADTALMNRRLQEWIEQMPAQYYWVHKRFKTRPAGEPSVY
ncbi:MAG: lysophospholipid acyltransferase family protein [Burkholderiales bacterium]